MTPAPSLRAALARRLTAGRLAALGVALAWAWQALPARAEAPPADATRPPWSLVVATGYDAGLTEGPAVTVTGGGQQVLDANEGLWVAAGGLFSFGPGRSWELQATVGVKANTAGTGAAGLSYRAVPLELLVARAWPRLRAAAGLSYAAGPAYRGSGFSSFLSQDLRDALGVVAQAELLGGAAGDGLRSAIGLRLTWQTLMAKDGTGSNASAVGLTAGFTY